ncbi:Hypothetical predicted protein [Octopus vulgaris]|uniref:ZSWIM3 N-terminal domain-containing protein n=1 Tax=Octopus vulgaris TaxID=6645 RepID=A0AA36FAP1_OCTVU|nr:Hypothetical predicted protein [Octopus vulgaris]
MATTGEQDVVAESVSLLTTEQSTATPTAVTELVVIPQQQLSSTSAADVLAATVLTTTTLEQEQQQQQQQHQQQYQHHHQQQQYHHQPQHQHEQSSDKISEDLLVSKALIEIGANEACRDLLNAGDEFEDFSALSSAIAAVCKLTNAVFTIHDCQTIAKANRSRCVKVEPLDEKFKYKYVKYVCKQFGYSRRRTVPGIRPNQKTYKTGCPALIAASVDREKQRMVIRSINLNHSHQMLGHMYPENRRQSLSPNVLTETYRLIDIGMKTKNIREYICNVTGKQLTTRDINNLKAKRKKELSPPLNHNTSNMVNHNNNNIHNNNNNINNNNNNIINCNDGHTKKKKRGTRDMEITSPISSHVFDISKGLPATGVPVLLFIQIEKRSWKLLQKSLCSK